MNTKLLILLMSVSPMAMAQDANDVRIERIYTNTNAAMQNADVYDGVGEETQQPVIKVIKKVQAAAPAPAMERVNALEDMSSSNSPNSPQVHIYNNNQNDNDNENENKSASTSEQAVESTATGESAVSQAYIQRANELRGARKEMEVGTEQKMIEKIEMSRIEDERRRAERLFGNRLQGQPQPQVQQVQPQQQPAQQVIVVKEQVIEKEVKQEAARLDDSASISTGPRSSSKWFGDEVYIAPTAGISEYGSAVNTKGNTALGVSVGSRFASGLGIEGSFIYSNYELEDFNSVSLTANCGSINCPAIRDVTQYNFMVNAKYSAALGMISPFAGVIAGFTYREYGGPSSLNINGSPITGDASSTAIDAGLNVGLDVKLAKNISIGAEYRWMTNVSYSRDDSTENNNGVNPTNLLFPQTAGKSRKPLEELGYQMFLINSKITF